MLAPLPLGYINQIRRKIKMQNMINHKIGIIRFIRFTLNLILVFLLFKMAYALPVPHGVGGVIYELDGITEVRRGINFYIDNINNGQIINGKTGYGSSGRYSAAIKGDDGDTIVVKAWNKYNQVNATFTLIGVMRNVNLMLNMSFPPIAPSIISQPITSAVEDQLYIYQVEAFDENDDLLFYSLLESPLDISINAASGLITWLPLNDDVGMHDVIVQAFDGLFAVNQSFTINVQNVNDKPKIISIPILNATQDTNYFYDVEAIDNDNEVLIYSLMVKPDGMVIDEATGIINWTPNNSQVGIGNVAVIVSDGNLTDIQEFTINVVNINDLPVIASLPITKAIEDKLYTYDVDAYDIDGDTLAYSLVSYPQGMRINSSNGNITWLPSNDDVGIHDITVKVSDDIGSVLQPFALLAGNINDAPIINSTPITKAKVGRTYTYYVDAYDVDNDLLEYNLAVSPDGMEIDRTNGLIEWKPKGKQIGNNAVIVEVSDGNLTTKQEFTILVYASEDKKESDSSYESGGTSSSSGGGGGGGSSALVPPSTKEFGQEKISVLGIKTKSLNVVLKVEELNERPKDASRISKRVYRYFKIEKINQEDIEETVINFTVELKWLNENGIKHDDIVLTRHTTQGWQDLITENVSKDDKFVYYVAKTPGFSYFAISVKEGVVVKSILAPQISKIDVPYRIFGIIYKFGKFKQLPQGTKISFENLNTSETIATETGLGPYQGAYYVLLHGSYGDLIKIRIGTIDKEYLAKLKDTDNLDFMINSRNTGFTSITGSAMFAILSDFSFLTIISFILIILLIILIKIKYKKR